MMGRVNKTDPIVLDTSDRNSPDVRHFTLAKPNTEGEFEGYEHTRTPTLCGAAPGHIPNTTTWQYVTCPACLKAMSQPR